MERGMKKWQPFNSVCVGSLMVKDVLNKKMVVKMPVLDDDKLREIQEKILFAYNSKDIISVKFYKNGRYFLQKGIITQIDKNERKIVLNNDLSLFFAQIVDIY